MWRCSQIRILSAPYARRYALFTLVGIAGEDDLDAPDLQTPTTQGSMPHELPGADNGGSGANRGHGLPRGRNGHFNGGHNRKIHLSAASPPALGPEQSAALRDRLVTEIDALSLADDAALWAHRCVAEKTD
jgi:hypothetical protein